MMTCHPGLQGELLASQALGSEPAQLLQVAIKWLGLHCAGSKDLLACLERSPRCEPARLLPELLAISGQDPGLLGLLAWRCLACNLLTGEELLALPVAAELLAGALSGLHAGGLAPSLALKDPWGSWQESCGCAGMQLNGLHSGQHQGRNCKAASFLKPWCPAGEPEKAACLPAAAALSRPPGPALPGSGPGPGDVARAFSTLTKLLATSAQTEHARRIAAQACLSLRASWGAAAVANSAGEPRAAATHAAAAGDWAQGAKLLARLVEVVSREVFPRELATRWVESELTAVLQAAPIPLPSGGQPPTRAAAAEAAQSAANWGEAMAAFAAALPLETILSQVQQALRSWGGEMLGEEAGAAHSSPWQRCGKLLAAAASASRHAQVGVEAWGRSQAVAGMQARDARLLRALLLLQRQLCASAQQYKEWLRSSLISGQAAGGDGGQAAGAAAGPGAGDVLLLVQAVLIPLLPDEEDAEMLEAQLAALEGLDLPSTAAQIVQEYRSGAQQRLRSMAKHAAQKEQAAKGQGISSPAPAAAGDGPGGSSYEQARDFASGQQQLGALLKEFQLLGGKLAPNTLADLKSRYENVFQRGAMTRQLLAALLQPAAAAGGAGAGGSGGGGSAGLAGVEERAALMQYLHTALPPRLSELRAAFAPPAVAQFRQRCLLAQLGGASLESLGASLAQVAAGVPGPHAVSPHQVLDRMGELVGREVRAVAAASGRRGSPSAKLSAVLEHLLNAFNAAYASCLGQGPAPSTAGAAGIAGMACHLVGIIHAHEELHGLLLHRVEQLIWEAGPAGKLEPCQALSLAMLAATVGAFLAPPAHQHQQQQQLPEALFRWKAGTAGAPAGAAGTACAELAGPLWLQRLLLHLPLRGAACQSWACRFSAALLSCLRHFHCFAPLEPPGPFSSRDWGLVAGRDGSGTPATEGSIVQQGAWGVQLAPKGRLALGHGRSYDGEWLSRLAYPLCPQAVQVLQWAQLRLGVAELLTDRGNAVAGGAAGQPDSWDAAEGGHGRGRELKRQRLHQKHQQEQQPGGAGERSRGQGAAEVLELCQAALGEDLGSSLLKEAGPLSLATCLCLEAAAAGGGSQEELICPLQKGAVLHAICGEYFRVTLQPPDGHPETHASPHSVLLLPPLQPLLPPAAHTAGSGPGQPSQRQQRQRQHAVASQDTQEYVPDSPDEEEGFAMHEGGCGPDGSPMAAAAAHGTGSAEGGIEGAGGNGLGLAELATAIGQEAAIACLRLAAAAEQSLTADDDISDKAPPSKHGTPAASLEVIQGSCAHLLRVVLQHSAARSTARSPSAMAAAGTGGSSCKGSSAGGAQGALAHFLLGLVRGCQRGIPARVVVASGVRRGAAAGGARGAGALGDVLFFDPQTLQGVASLAGAIAKGLSIELLPLQGATQGVPLGLEAACLCWQSLAGAVEGALGDASKTDAEMLAGLLEVLG